MFTWFKEWLTDQQYRLRKWLKEWLCIDGVIDSIYKVTMDNNEAVKQLQALVFKGQTVIVGDIYFNKGANSFIVVASQRDAGYVKIVPFYCTNLHELKLWAKDLEQRFGVDFKDQIYDTPVTGMLDWKDRLLVDDANEVIHRGR